MREIIRCTTGGMKNRFSNFIQNEITTLYNIREAQFQIFYDHPEHPFNRALYMNIHPNLVQRMYDEDKS